MNSIHCRLLAVGTPADLDAFEASNDWPTEVRAVELLERSPNRRLWQFDVRLLPTSFLHRVSVGHPRLVLVLHHDTGRVMGLMAARCGRLQRRELDYRP